MSTELSTYTWHVTYNDYSSSVGGPKSTTITLEAAYFGDEEHLVMFKDADHQVVLALHAGIVSTISRADAAAEWKYSE
jgi:hypothetical protein